MGAHNLAALDAHCETEGRGPATIERTVIGYDDPLEDTDAFLATAELYAQLGIELLWVSARSDDPAGASYFDLFASRDPATRRPRRPLRRASACRPP